MLWLRRNTSLRGGQSVAFADDSVLVILSDIVDPARPSIHQVSFRQEATKIDFVSRTGGRSIRGAADFDCATGRVKAQSIALYSGQDLRGDQILSQGAELDFRAPVYGTASALVLAEVCRPRRPGNAQVATAPPPPPFPPAQSAPAPIASVGPPAPRSPAIAEAPLQPPAPPARPAPLRPPRRLLRPPPRGRRSRA